MNTLVVRVQRKHQEAEGIFSYTLTALPGEALPDFTAGSHVDVHAAPGVVRQYSLCNAPVERGRYRIAVLREQASRGGSAGMHDLVQEGQLLTISEPKNHFPLVPASRTLLFAGGIGITPLLSMAYELHAAGQSFELHYCSRSQDRMAFRQELSQAPFADAVHFHTDDGDPGQRFEAPPLLTDPNADTHLYVCGPKGFIDHVLTTAKDCRWQDEQLHREYFGADPASNADGEAFEVVLSASGQRLLVPSDKSVLEVLLVNGVDVPFSCESGVCGTCLTTVLEGCPDHRDSFLTDKERKANTQFLPCCSRSKSPLLVLDL